MKQSILSWTAPIAAALLLGSSPAWAFPSAPSCGDGVINQTGEQCDDGNTINGDKCSSTCQIEPWCGDGNLDAGEACDDGNNTNGDGCSSACTVEASCGDGNKDEGEECDDGNRVDGDGCDSNCTVEPFCGDDILQVPEQCDDGNTANGDGCSFDCEIEEPPSGEGCTPGYWKQSQHFDSWSGGYVPTTQFSAVFENAFPGMTLLQVLKQGGGGLIALGRHTVAALLNGASAGVDYGQTAGDVVNAFNAVYPGSDDAYETLHYNFKADNELGCPLN
jgi:cysteine-rich repeat protein